jgi:integrase/recombinase XerD
LFILSTKVIEKIKALIDLERLGKKSNLFVSNRGKKYNVKSLQLIVKKAMMKAGIDKNVCCHTLRHSIATHLIENSYDVSLVQ